jgi:FtsP/CotA-like multicopper oxidase with cupredoxin domain
MTRYHETSMHVRLGWFALVAVGLAAAVAPTIASAGITGLDLVGSANPNITLTAREGYISVADGGSVYSWGYAEGARDGGGTMQLPGPTLIVQQGARVNVRLYNDLPTAAGNVSIVFPGHVAKPCRRGQVDTVSGECTAVSGVTGGLVQEAQPGAFVDYTFVAGEPGTYQYHSGTQPDLQVEMGLYGALIVRPATVPAGCGAAAYSHPGACYDREYLYLLSEIDMDIHQAAELQRSGPGPIVLPSGAYHSEYWLMNGRAGPDTMAGDNLGTMPHQPYGSLTRMHPGERLLIRLVGAGREQHPFHTHGNHSRLLARDGRMLLNDVGNLAGPLLFTIPSVPGGTADAIFEWTGKDLGWDMYGHAPSDPLEPNEWAPDHGKEIPVTLPSLSSMAFGGFYSGSPYLGGMGSLPPGEGGLNPNAGFAYMWHSHTERELVNNDVFPGGMMTMLIVEAPGVDIP